MSNVLVIGDIHLPFQHEDYLAFCKRIYKAYKCNKVVMIGDLVDNHSISYHEHDPNGLSPDQEMKLVDTYLKPWFKSFPRVKLCLGNHDRMVDRKSRTVGLPDRCFKRFRNIWNLPKGWEDDFEFEIDGVLYKHGTGYSGQYAHRQAAIDARQSCVIGHLHSVAGVEWIANSKQIMFGMSVGCGISKKAYTFAYGRDFKRKPIISCGIVTDCGLNAMVLPMKME